MIKIRDLTVRYGSLTAVDSVSLDVKQGELFGLVGPNGAGKTTTLKVLAGLLLPASGTATVQGFDIVTDRMAVQRNLGYMADFFGVYDYLTTHEYLAFFGGVYGIPKAILEQRIPAVLETTGLLAKDGARIRELSRGMKQRLYFARALIHDPDLLILDEPASGMDPRGRAELVGTLRTIHERGKTIIISSHILGELQGLCTSVGIMEKGRLVDCRSLHGRTGPAERQVVLSVHRDDREKARTVAAAQDGVSQVEPHGSRIVITLTDNDETVSNVVRALVKKNVRILLPRYEAANLQDVFLQMTKGETA